MKAMILAAGRGARLSPLTDTTPKPLLTVAGKTLLDWQLDKLCHAGFKDFVINLGYLGEQIRAHLNERSRTGINIQFSIEPQTALETGGGILQALPLLGDAPFAVINADVWSDFDFGRLKRFAAEKQSKAWRGHLVLVANPAHNLKGDFGLHNGYIMNDAAQMYTFAGFSVLHPRLFDGQQPGRFPLAPILQDAARAGTLSGEIHPNQWNDIGTAERLNEINNIDLAIQDKTEI